MRRLLLSLALAPLLLACRPSGSQPISVVDSYARALRSGDYGKAYELMSKKYQDQHRREEFVAMMKESSEEVRQTVARLTGDNRRVEVVARFVYDDLRDEISLVQEGGAWRIATDPLDFYPQDSPVSALRSFVRAVELKRYDIALKIIPNRWREAMDEAKLKAQFEGPDAKAEEGRQLLAELRANLDRPIEQTGDKANMPYGDNKDVQFVQEDGVWKIDDLD
jgi:hypothetical protein